jgi:zinc protease
MADVLQNRLRETLREDLGGTYGVSVSPGYSKIPREEYQLDIRFGASPDRLEELVKVVFDEIEKLKTGGPTPKQVSDIKETMLRDLETSNQSNGFLLTNIAVRYQTGEDLETLFNLDDYYQKIDAEMIQTAARTYLNADNYTIVELFPERQ